MDFRGSCLAQKLYNPCAGCSADYRIVNHNNTLASDRVRNGIELDSDLVLAVLLAGSDERPSDIFVFDEADAVGDSGLLGIADGGVKAGVRNADNNVRLNGMLQGEESACSDPCRVNAAAVDYRIGAGKVDVFKNAERAGLFVAVVFNGAHAVFIKNNNLSGLDVADKLRPHCVKRAAFRGNDVAPVGCFAVAKRTEAVLVAHGNKL